MAVENGSPPNQMSPEMSQERMDLLADKLAPVEEQKRMKEMQADKDTALGSFKISHAILDEDESNTSIFRLQPIVLAIVGFALAFIAFITYLIATTPTSPAR
jgi:hypothetical protein